MVKRKQDVLNQAGIFSEDLSDAAFSIASHAVNVIFFPLHFSFLLIKREYYNILIIFNFLFNILQQSSQKITNYFNESTSAIQSDINENVAGKSDGTIDQMECDPNDSYKQMLDDDEDDTFMLDIDC